MSTWAGVALSVGIALVVGLVVHHYGLKQLAYEHSVAGGVTAGALTLLAAGDLFVEASREFWTQRPMLAATVTGGLMLGFTVLVVDGVINSRRAREMRKVLVGPVADLLWRSLLGELSTASDALASVLRPREAAGDREMVWSSQPGIEQGLSALGVSARDIGTAVTELRGDLLAGGDQMHALYRACWSVVRAAHSAQEVVAGFRASSVPVYDSFIKLGTQNVDGEIGRAEWEWNRVGRAYNVLVAALETLNSEAQEVVGDELQELRGFTIEGPGQLPGFPDPSHMYYM